MGMLVEGRWVEEDRRIRDGAFVRPRSAFGGPIGEETVRAVAEEPGRFHLVASLSCPWSHRVALVRALKGLEALVPLHVAGGPRTQGYRLAAPSRTWPVPGSDRRVGHLHELYALADPRHTGRVTVPVLWDARERRIVSNESARILRALDRVPAPRGPDWTLRPARLAEEIDRLCERAQAGLSNAVYRAGHARRQDAYEEAVEEVIATLGLLEERLARSRFLHGDAPAETDLRLWPTLARFDEVYHGHFKCSRRRLRDHPNLWAYARDLHGWRSVAATLDRDAVRAAYYGEDRDVNPHGVVAAAPDIDWAEPHDRDRLGAPRVWLRDGRAASVDPATLQIGTGA